MSTGKIYFCFRRHDTRHMAGRLFHDLTEHFSRDRLILEDDSISPGLKLVDHIKAAFSTCSAMLVLIGDSWLASHNNTGARNLDNPNDIVRLEIEIALELKLRIIPVLVDDATPPRIGDIPKSIETIARLNCARLRHENYRADLDRLSAVLMSIIPSIAVASKNKAQLVDLFCQVRRDGGELSHLMDALEHGNLDLLNNSLSIQAAEDHLHLFPNGRTRPIALARLEYLIWNEIQNSTDYRSFSRYLRQFPAGSYANEAKERRRHLLMDHYASGVPAPRIFISYRRIDSQDSADRIYRTLTQWTPHGSVIMDVDKKSITPGLSIRRQLAELVSSCHLILVLINGRWVREFLDRAEMHEDGTSIDFVRTEIMSALDKGDTTPVVPVLLGDTPAPDTAALPLDVKPLMERSAYRLSREQFDADLKSLIAQTTTIFEDETSK